LIARWERDPASAAAEYGAEFRRDIESFLSIEVLRACISTGVHERPQLEYLILDHGPAFLRLLAGRSRSRRARSAHCAGHQQDF
jgi:hypothetical protein